MTHRFLPPVFAFALTCSPVLPASSISQEEVAVRGAYSAVVLRTQMASISSSYFTDQLSTDPQLSLHLRDIHGGAVSEILSMPLSDVVTVPSGELLISSRGSYSIIKYDSSNAESLGSFLQVQGWGPVNARYGFDKDYYDSHHIFDAPVRELLEADLAGPGEPYSRYLMFSGALSARGKERVYKALALFRDGAPEPTIVDYVLGFHEDLVGEHLASELVNLRRVLPLSEENRTKLSEFLRSIAVSGACVTDPATQLCCDPISRFCGISDQVLDSHE